MNQYFKGFCFMVGILCCSPSFAEDYSLYVSNNSDETITLTKEDGTQLIVPPQGSIDKVKFKTDSTVANYIKGKKVCSWYIPKPSNQFTVFGLGYDPNRYGDMGCNIYLARTDE